MPSGRLVNRFSSVSLCPYSPNFPQTCLPNIKFDLQDIFQIDTVWPMALLNLGATISMLAGILVLVYIAVSFSLQKP